MCAITFLKACTLSRISSARGTFYIQNCFYSEQISRVPNLKKLYLEIFKYHIKKKILVDYFRSKKVKKIFRRKKNVDCKSPMKWPIVKNNYEFLSISRYITFLNKQYKSTFFADLQVNVSMYRFQFLKNLKIFMWKKRWKIFQTQLINLKSFSMSS